MSDMNNWREELWRDGLDEASSDSDFWTAGTEWGAEWMLKRLENAKADAWDEGFSKGWDRGHYESGDETNPYR